MKRFPSQRKKTVDLRIQSAKDRKDQGTSRTVYVYNFNHSCSFSTGPSTFTDQDMHELPDDRYFCYRHAAYDGFHH